MDKRQRRHFRRYKIHSRFDLFFGKKTFSAELVDYSVNGVGIIVEGFPPALEGGFIDIDISEPAIRTKGEIVWIKKSGSGVRIGIKKIGLIHGSLENYNLADIFIGFQRSRVTGILEVRTESVRKKIYIRDGNMIFTESDQADDGLGEILLREGRINLGQYNHFLTMLKKSVKKQGIILVELGYLKPKELVHSVMNQAEEIIISLFDMENGVFEFRKCLIPDEVITLKLSPLNLIYKGIKRIREHQKLKKYRNFLPISDATIIHFSSDTLPLSQSIMVDETGREVLSYIDGKTTIKDILLLSHQSEFETLKTLYALLSTGVIEIVDKGSEVKNTREASERISPEDEDIVKKSKGGVQHEIINKIETTYTAFKNAGYYEIFGLRESAPFDEIKKAYHRAVKEFHPDRYEHLDSDDLKSKLNTIFYSIIQAYEILSDPEKKKQYDMQLPYKNVQEMSHTELAKIRFNEAIAEFKNKNFAQATEFFGQATYLDSSIAKYHYYYGLSLGKLSRYKEAERAIQKALKIDSVNADYLAELGHVYLNLGFFARARSSFEKALTISPSHRRASEGIITFKK